MNTSTRAALCLLLILCAVTSQAGIGYDVTDHPPHWQPPTAMPDVAIPLNLGGDTFETAAPIEVGGPFNGFTNGFSDDYDFSTELGSDGGSPDVVYRLEVETPATLIFDLCTSDFDARLFLLGEDAATVKGYSDDGCQSNPAAPQLTVSGLEPGLHYLVVDGSNGDSGAFSLYVHVWSGCELIDCAPGTFAEIEPNGGCDTPDYLFQWVEIGDCICGNAWSGPVERDTDWFKLAITVPSRLLLELRADEFDPMIWLMSDSEVNCYSDIILARDEYGFCEMETLTSESLVPGQYLICIAHNGWQSDINGTYELLINAETSAPTLVELIAFDAVPTNDCVQLTWETTGESTFPNYNVSRDGTLVTQIPAEDTSYQYYDFDVMAGFSYSYELQAVSFNGDIQVLASQDVTVPLTLELSQNYPNPFNPVTMLSFRIASDQQVNLSVFNLAGERVACVFDGALNAGEHAMTFDGSDLPSGTYFYTLQADGRSLTRKMLLLK